MQTIPEQPKHYPDIVYGLMRFFVFTIPMENVLVLPLLGSVTRLAGVLVMAAMALFVFYSGTTKRPNTMLLFMLFMVLLSFASVTWSMDANLTLRRSWTFLQLLAMVWLIGETVQSNKGLSISLFRCYVYGAFVPILYSVAFFLSHYGVNLERFVASGFDPNELGLVLALAIPMAWMLAITTSKQASKNVYRFFIAAALFAILLGASRGSFLAALMALSIVPFSLKYMERRERKIMIALIPFLLLLIAFVVPASSWARLGTIGEEVVSGTLNRRKDIWMAGIHAFAQQPILGIGTGAYAAMTNKVMNYPWVAHNSFLSVLVEQGIVGFFVFLTILILVTRRVLLLKGLPRVFSLTMFLTWSVGVMALSWEHRKPTWFVLAMLAFADWSQIMDLDHQTSDKPGRTLWQRVWSSVIGAKPGANREA